MSDLIIQESSLTAIADAIRYVTGNTDSIVVKDMPSEIDNIELPDSEVALFGINNAYEGKYSITSDRLNEIANETQRLSNTEEALLPSQIVERLKNVVDDDEFMEGAVFKIHNDTVTKIKPYLCYGDGTITSIDCPNVEIVGDYSFYNCDKLTNVNMPHVVSVGNYGFYDCDAIVSLSFDELKSAGDNSFNRCGNLETFYAPKLKTINITMFQNCEKLKEINCPEVETIDSTLANKPFNNTALVNVYFPKLTSIPKACCYGLKSLQSIDFPLAQSIDYQSFTSCNNLKAINLPMCTSLNQYAFEYVPIEDINGASVHMPLVKNIGFYCFCRCEKLKTAYLPEVTSVEQGVFSKCTALTTCEFDKQVSMTDLLFENCSNLEALILRSETMCPISDTNAFNNSSIAAGTGYIYVPSALVDTYKSNDRWSVYAEQIRALEDYVDVLPKRYYIINDAMSQYYSFNKYYVDCSNGYSIKTTYDCAYQELEIDDGCLISFDMSIDNTENVDGLVVTV